MKKCCGLTIIELLVAVSLVGLLAGLTWVVFDPLTQAKKARDARRKKDLNRIAKLLEDYYNDNNQYPDSLDLSGCNDKLNGISLPCDPLDNSQYQYCYITSSDKQKYKIYARLENPSDPQAKPNLPNPNYNFGVTSPNTSIEEDFGDIESNCYLIASNPTPTPTPTTPPPPSPTPTPVVTPTNTPTPIPTPTTCLDQVKTNYGGYWVHPQHPDDPNWICVGGDRLVPIYSEITNPSGGEGNCSGNIIGYTFPTWVDTPEDNNCGCSPNNCFSISDYLGNGHPPLKYTQPEGSETSCYTWQTGAYKRVECVFVPLEE